MSRRREGSDQRPGSIRGKRRVMDRHWTWAPTGARRDARGGDGCRVDPQRREPRRRRRRKSSAQDLQQHDRAKLHHDPKTNLLFCGQTRSAAPHRSSFLPLSFFLSLPCPLSLRCPSSLFSIVCSFPLSLLSLVASVACPCHGRQSRSPRRACR